MKQSISKSFGSLNISIIRSSAVLPKILLSKQLTGRKKGILDILTFKISLSVVPGVGFSGIHFEIPKRLRPSPLRLTFRDLKNPSRKISIKKINLNFLDFGAFCVNRTGC